MITCEICFKKIQVGFNRPHSLHRTKRLIKPNIQKNLGRKICTRCLRTLNKKN
ncbi:MAG TPA: bL28 family ribosomal protein [Patescibacteria group bacterium]|nr:bL28 family ribosomal protein [Patescibacteria group bacterium]